MPNLAQVRHRAALGLVLCPVVVLLAALTLPHVVVTEWWSALIAFAGAGATPLLALAVAASAEAPLRRALTLAGVSVGVLVACAARALPPLAQLVAVDTALVTLAWGLGTSLGNRVQHASHLFPACVVAACADLVSLLSPEGPSRAIAASERALSLLAFSFPVPGTHAAAPALGVGDLLFVALVFGVARRHALPYARSVGLCALGIALAGLASGWLGVAVPALLPIAFVLLLGLPRVRQLRRVDRGAAIVSMLLACTVALAALLRQWLAPG